MTERAPPQVKYRAKPHLDIVCEALRKASGVVEAAARLLQMDGANLRRYIRHNPKCQAVCAEAREKIKDLAETGLVELLNQRDFKAIQFVLLTIGKTRGYTMPKGVTATDAGGGTTNIMIGSVTITPVKSGDYVKDGPKRLEDPGDGKTIEGDPIPKDKPEDEAT